MTMPRRHPREQNMQLATSGLAIAMHSYLEEEYPDLTSAEYLYVVQGAAQSILNGFIQTALRMERHGDPDTPSGWAPEPDEDPSTEEL